MVPPDLSSTHTGTSPLLRAATPLCPAVLCPSRFLPLGIHPLRGQQAKFGHSGWPPVSRRQVLLFHASACDELTPPLHRAPPGPHAGRSPAEGTPSGEPLSPGRVPSPGFDADLMSFDASAVVHTRSSSRRSPDPVLPGLFPERSPRRLLTAAAPGGLGSPPARRARRANPHHRHSTVQSGDLLHHHQSPFRTHGLLT